jgi:hypothetical protein
MFRQSIEYPEPVLPGSARKSLFEKLCKTPHVSIGNLTAAYRGKRQGRHYRLPSIDVDDARLSKEWRTWARLTRRSFASAPFPQSPDRALRAALFSSAQRRRASAHVAIETPLRRAFDDVQTQLSVAISQEQFSSWNLTHSRNFL